MPYLVFLCIHSAVKMIVSRFHLREMKSLEQNMLQGSSVCLSNQEFMCYLSLGCHFNRALGWTVKGKCRLSELERDAKVPLVSSLTFMRASLQFSQVPEAFQRFPEIPGIRSHSWCPWGVLEASMTIASIFLCLTESCPKHWPWTCFTYTLISTTLGSSNVHYFIFIASFYRTLTIHLCSSASP